ncbi:hypothetical protein [Schwartzia succinivorans]|jgi:hypothetical protein|uniref:Uncharacterized protein n=1 Tax=Schwartzia succinivorans DSM 10502 TaxID=1123243 RepID=A0A1M4YWR5_9FIRM|nr:hypothetical protein [Schwartzia succinivorans]SHF10241.1 hypothetical protein SAMN02745190_01836 [Schwartzia succinivorans DSM 10502]
MKKWLIVFFLLAAWPFNFAEWKSISEQITIEAEIVTAHGVGCTFAKHAVLLF